MTRSILNNLKNSVGFKTNRKIVVFSVDDYGNIRVASSKAQKRMIEAGLYGKWSSRFDYFDTLETSDDLSILFEALMSVKDKSGRAAVFTPFANCANIDFETIRKNGYDTYRYKPLPDVLNMSKDHKGSWELWKYGILNRLFVPQFHGREHLNINLFNKLLLKKDKRIRVCIDNDSYTNMDFINSYNVKYNEAFSFDVYSENEMLKSILKDGLDLFDKVFGFRAHNFNSPGSHMHTDLEPFIKDYGIKYIDSNILKKEHQGGGYYKYKVRFMGQYNQCRQIYLLRNCIFEPTLSDQELAIKQCLDQIEIAFNWKKPAIISSHRVNFCGLIDSKNREKGISSLRNLLYQIVIKWPDVEFFTAQELGNLIEESNV